MIIEWLCEMASSIIIGMFHSMEFISLPFDLINTLGAILQYGTWVVGSDILLMFASSVTLWIGAKLSVGLALRIWELLPLT